MNSRILLKSQKNDILAIIQEHGLDPGVFSWVETPSPGNPHRIISRLNYRQTNFFYTFDMDGEVHSASFSPARQSCIGSDYPVTWTGQKACFSDWLLNLIKEENEPDLWENHDDRGERHVHGQHHQTYVVAEPSHQSPDPDLMATRLNVLLEQQSRKEPKPNLSSPIRRYYGKA